jgi:hydroxymethylglutaryl-CoA lyase
MQHEYVTLVECPRDAMQGWHTQIPAAQKIEYINLLLQVGFDVLDCGSFVSPKAVPQMADTPEVLNALQAGETKLLVIVANERGANDAVTFTNVSILGYPFSVSPTFQQLNANSTIEDSVNRVRAIKTLCDANGKELVVYLSMAFGNPYGDPYDASLVAEYANLLAGMGVNTLSLADTVGLATPDQVFDITRHVIESHPNLTIGVHLHSTATNWRQKLDAALQAGCRRFDGALKGIGGCPMAKNELVGNMNTEWMLEHFESKGLLKPLNKAALDQALNMASAIFV